MLCKFVGVIGSNIVTPVKFADGVKVRPSANVTKSFFFK